MEGFTHVLPKPLKRIPRRAFIRLLIMQIESPDDPYRIDAIRAAGKYSNARLRGPLIACLWDSDAIVRGVAAGALGDMTELYDCPVEVYYVSAKDPSHWVRQCASSAIRRSKNINASYLRELARDPDEMIASIAADILKERGL